MRLRRWLAFGSLLIVGVTLTALVHAAQTTSILSLLAHAPLSGQAMVDKLQLKGPDAATFAKSWEDESSKRQATLRELADALAGAGSDRGSAKHEVDRFQTALTHVMDNYVQSNARLAHGLSDEQQARLVGGGDLYKIVQLDGMRQALPALADYIIDGALKKAPGMDDATRQKLAAARKTHLAHAMDLLIERATLKNQLGDAASRAKALPQLEKNHLAMAETLAEGLRDMRAQLTDDQATHLLVSLQNRLTLLKKNAAAN